MWILACPIYMDSCECGERLQARKETTRGLEEEEGGQWDMWHGNGKSIGLEVYKERQEDEEENQQKQILLANAVMKANMVYAN